MPEIKPLWQCQHYQMYTDVLESDSVFFLISAKFKGHKFILFFKGMWAIKLEFTLYPMKEMDNIYIKSIWLKETKALSVFRIMIYKSKNKRAFFVDTMWEINISRLFNTAFPFQTTRTHHRGMPTVKDCRIWDLLMVPSQLQLHNCK